MQTNTLRSVLVFGIIGLLLLAAVVLGVQFAKNRSTQTVANEQQVATNNNGQQAEQPPASTPPPENNQPPEPTPSTPPPSEPTPQPDNTDNNGEALGNNSNQAQSGDGTIRVPATGGEDILLAAVALSLVGFSTVIYLKSRRELTTLR